MQRDNFKEGSMIYRILFSGIFIIFSSLALSGCHSEKPKKSEESEVTEAKDQTTKNLETALAGEGEANRKYTVYAEIADKEGYPSVARLWRAAAAAEGIHAKNHMKVLGMLNNTESNLRSAVTGEQYEFTTMYPKFIKTAEEAGNMAAAQSMKYAFEVEQLHYKMFEKDLKDLEEGKKPELVPYWVCGVCGNTVPKSPPEVCPICGSPRKVFFEVK